MKMDGDERELLESVEHGEWKSAGGGEAGASRVLPIRWLRFARTAG